MAFVEIPDVVQVTLIGSIDGQQTNNNLYFRNLVDEITPVNMATLVAAIGTWYSDTVLTLLSVSFSLVRTHARYLGAQNSFEADTLVGAGSGGGGGAFVPQNVSPCISFRTGISGRSGRGRNYIPGIPQGVVDGNTLQASYADDLRIAYAQLLPAGDVLDLNWTWVVASRFTGGAERPTGVAADVVAVLFTDLTVDSQRRRLPGRGR